MRKGYLFLMPLTIALLLVLSACSASVNLPGQGSQFTPLQVLQNSANAMQKLKSSHVDLQSTSTVQTSGQAQPATGTPTPSGTPTTSNVSLTITGNGDQQLPNQQQMHLNIATLNQTAAISEIVQGDKVYIQNAQGQWFVLNQSDFQNLAFNPFAGVNLDQNSLIGLIMHTTISDHGMESVNGQSLRHITADLDKTALRQLLTDNPQLRSSLGQQNIDSVIDNLQAFLASVDVWIDETQFYVHRTQLKLNMLANIPSTDGSLPRTINTTLNTTVDLSKFNVPVNIITPSNATPTDNPGSIIGIGKP